MCTCYANMVGMSSTTEHTAKCQRCGRTRRFRTATAACTAKPYGRICQARILLAAVNDAIRGFARHQVDKARELIADGGLIPTGRPGIFRAVSSDGERSYLTSPQACGCPSGLRRLTATNCKHSLAALILVAAGKAA
jgi:ribosomal protein L37E